ncbi:MAG: hypothetical protein D6706_07740 [Chloroflexi bacterium]|nr:MAG: hypothetical protein D6706_07740 [Chloroflexota bacterium]
MAGVGLEVTDLSIATVSVDEALNACIVFWVAAFFACAAVGTNGHVGGAKGIAGAVSTLLGWAFAGIVLAGLADWTVCVFATFITFVVVTDWFGCRACCGFGGIAVGALTADVVGAVSFERGGGEVFVGAVVAVKDSDRASVGTLDTHVVVAVWLAGVVLRNAGFVMFDHWVGAALVAGSVEAVVFLVGALTVG